MASTGYEHESVPLDGSRRSFIGVLLGLAWQGAAIFAAVWLGVAYLTRLSSLSALVACVAAPVALALMGRIEIAVFAALMTVLIFWMHRVNIRRLLKGEEPKIGAKA